MNRFEVIDMHAHNRINLDVDNLVQLYEGGMSEKALAEKLGVSRTVVRIRLLERGIEPRGGSASMYLRMSQTDAAERRRIAAGANAARRGTKASAVENERKAAWKQETLIKVGRGEAELADLLRDRGVVADMQKAVGPYNIDLMCGTVAVEVHSQTFDPHGHTATRKRIEYLLNRGLNVIYVKCFISDRVAGRNRFDFCAPAAADDVAAFVKRTEGDPSFIRQYRVIRSTGELLATCSGNLDHVTRVRVPRRRRRDA